VVDGVNDIERTLLRLGHEPIKTKAGLWKCGHCDSVYDNNLPAFHNMGGMARVYLCRSGPLVRLLDRNILDREKEAEAAYETLRDRFAMAALTGLLSDPNLHGKASTAKMIPVIAYELADTMLEARKK
jgi:hypothetical protein